MTVEDLSGGAPASVDTSATAEIQTNAPDVGASDFGTARSAIDRAFDTVDAMERGETPEKPAATAEKPAAAAQDRNPDGTFKAKLAQEQAQQPEAQQAEDKTKPAADAKDAPARFASDPEAKAGWAQTPDAVKGAINRTIRELEGGLERYRQDATVYNQVFRPYVDMAVNSKQDPGQLLKTYVDIDVTLGQDFGRGIQMIFQRSGEDPRAWAQAILGQPQTEGGQQAPDPAKDRVIADLTAKIEQLERGFGGINQTITQERVGQTLTSFTAGLSDGDKALFAELDNEVAAILTSDPQISLSDAFLKARNDAQTRYQRIFGRAPSDGAQSPFTTTPAPAQTRTPGTGGSDPRRGQLSVTGAPGPGNNAGSRKVPSSPREALDGAFAALGL